jgi:hypothetical protein
LQEALIKRSTEGADGVVSTSPVHVFLSNLDITVAKPPCVFIGHGRSQLWGRVERFIERELNIATIDFESEPHAGESYAFAERLFCGKKEWNSGEQNGRHATSNALAP